MRAIEQDPYRYGLELEEVQRRRKLVDDVGDEVEQMHQELQQAVSNAAPGDALPNPTEFDAALEEEERGRSRGSGGDDYYASMEQQRQSELMHEQDEQLDGVFRTVGNLRQQADDMGRELEDQAVMIDEVDSLADRVGGKLSNGMSRIKHIVRKNEGMNLLGSFLSGNFGIVWESQFKLTFLNRYMVLLLYRGAHFRSRLIINPPHCTVIIHKIKGLGKERHNQTGGSLAFRVQLSCEPSCAGATHFLHPHLRPFHPSPFRDPCLRDHRHSGRIELQS